MVKNELQRKNLSAEIADIIRKMIFNGGLAPGERVNEVHLAEKLGVSRTPLRESLSALASEGAVDVKSRRGFFVRELTVEDARSIYSIRTILDPEALSLSGLPTPTQLRKTESINDALRAAINVDEGISLDDQWHFSLYRNCTNYELLDLIKTFMGKTRRYELASMGEKDVLIHSYASKSEIETLLKNGDLEGACKRLKISLTTGVDPVLAWLNKRITSK